MADDLSRDDVDALSVKATRLLVDHSAGSIETERARDEIEQLIAEAAGQLGEQDRRAVGLFAEHLIGAVWSETLSVQEACSQLEAVVVAAAANSSRFHDLLTKAVG